jgi:competence protein ComEC
MKETVKKYWKWGAGVFILSCCGLGLYIAHFELRAKVLEVYFFDLDRGRSVFIRTPHNQTILIDGGQNSQVLRELTKVLPFYRRRIDTVIVTNSPAKNTGGLSEVVRRYDVRKVMKPSIMGTSTALVAFEKEIARENLTPEDLQKGDSFEIGGIQFDVLFPDPSFKFNKTSMPELVLQISYLKHNILLLGDASKTIQKSFIPSVDHVDIIEYAHSAGDSRTSGDLFAQLNPKYAVIKKQIRAPSTRVAKNPPKKPPFNIEKQEGVEIINLETEGGVKFILSEEGVERK